jgi:hypothetical protein
VQANGHALGSYWVPYVAREVGGDCTYIVRVFRAHRYTFKNGEKSNHYSCTVLLLLVINHGTRVVALAKLERRLRTWRITSLS